MGISKEAKEDSREEGKYSMGMAIPWSSPYWDRAALYPSPYRCSSRGMSKFSPVFKALRAAELKVQGRAMWHSPWSTPWAFSRRRGVFRFRLRR